MTTINTGSLPAWANREAYNCCFVIDTNCINARRQIADLNQLESWKTNGVITIEMAERAAEEASRGNEAREQKARAYLQWISCMTDDEKKVHAEIENTLFPSGCQNQNQQNDVEIVFSAWKYNKILITNDGDSKTQPGGILGNAEALRACCCVSVMRPSEAVEYVREAIKARDFVVRTACQKYGAPEPEWLGTD